MARTISQIYQSIVNEKQSMPTLAGLLPSTDNLSSLLADTGSSPSLTARWRLWAFIVAVCLYTHETLWDTFMALVITTIANKQPGTILWYQNQGFLFQYGDPLTYVNGKWVYSPVNPAHQIVNLCAAVEQNGGILYKVAILSGGTISQLSSGQLIAFNAYSQKIKYGGPPVICVSAAADLLQLPLTIYFDPLILDATGQSIATSGDFPVEDAINNYIATISGANNPALFNGIFDANKFQDIIEAVPGVIDVQMGNLQATYGSLPYSSIGVKYQSSAGYMKVDPSYPLSSTITYIANV